MEHIDSRNLSVCIQGLQDAIKYAEFLSRSDNVEEDDHKESIFMYERELIKMVDLYKKLEKDNKVNIPLAKLVSEPYLELLS